MTGRRFTVPAEGGTLFPAVRQAENIRFRQSGTCCRPEIFSEKRNASDALRPVGHFRSRSGLRSTRRPDRVLTKGAEAVVIDYKFGLKKHNRHTRQVEEYMRLLGRMGYQTVRGYLWYVELKQVENVG